MSAAELLNIMFFVLGMGSAYVFWMPIIRVI